MFRPSTMAAVGPSIVSLVFRRPAPFRGLKNMSKNDAETALRERLIDAGARFKSKYPSSTEVREILQQSSILLAPKSALFWGLTGADAACDFSRQTNGSPLLALPQTKTVVRLLLKARTTCNSPSCPLSFGRVSSEFVVANLR